MIASGKLTASPHLNLTNIVELLIYGSRQAVLMYTDE